jgi:hypothetical protein
MAIDNIGSISETLLKVCTCHENPGLISTNPGTGMSPVQFARVVCDVTGHGFFFRDPFGHRFIWPSLVEWPDAAFFEEHKSQADSSSNSCTNA